MSAEYEDVSHVVASTYRTVIVDDLANGPSTPSNIAERTGVEIAHVSRGISRLRERGIVELLVPESTKKGRIYGLTKHGKATVEALEIVQRDGQRIVDNVDDVTQIKAQTRKLCELVDDQEAAHKIRSGAQLALVRRDA